MRKIFVDRTEAILAAIKRNMPNVKSKKCRNRLSKHWVYLISDASGCLLYVGMTRNVRDRIAEHKRSSRFWADGCIVETMDALTRRAALNLEAKIIRDRKPIHNKMHNTANA